MLFITDEKELILSNDKRQVLYFYASWMPFHKKMLNMLNKAEEKYKDVQFYAMDVDFFKNFIKRFDLKELPTIILMDNGHFMKRMKGIMMTSALMSAFHDIYGNRTLGELNVK